MHESPTSPIFLLLSIIFFDVVPVLTKKIWELTNIFNQYFFNLSGDTVVAEMKVVIELLPSDPKILISMSLN